MTLTKARTGPRPAKTTTWMPSSSSGAHKFRPQCKQSTAVFTFLFQLNHHRAVVEFDILYYMNWSFAIVNGKLAEIFFERKKGKLFVSAHCYVKESEYKTKKEKRWIKRDAQNNRFTYKKWKYLAKTKTA